MAGRGGRGPATPSRPRSTLARVLVDVPLAHLDRSFYAVPATMADDARPGKRGSRCGSRVRTSTASCSSAAHTDHDGRLTPLRRVVSAEPVLTGDRGLAGELAARYAGTRPTCCGSRSRPGTPPREKKPSPPAPAPPAYDAGAAEAAWPVTSHYTAYLRHLAEGSSPRAVWTAAPATDPAPPRSCRGATRASGRGPGSASPTAGRRPRRRGPGAVLGPDQHVTLGGRQRTGPLPRRLPGGEPRARHRVGTRAASAPVHDLGLVVVWDDGTTCTRSHGRRAPTPARPCCCANGRALRSWSAASCTVEAEYLLRTGWARSWPDRAARRRVTVSVVGGRRARPGGRVPHEVHLVLRRALETGPVLVQTPDRATSPRSPASAADTRALRHLPRDPTLRGPTEPPACRWCSAVAEDWACAECGHRGCAPRAGRRPDRRGWAGRFPTRIRTSSGERVPRPSGRGRDRRRHPGAELVADGGYAAVVLLDTWLLLSRVDLRGARRPYVAGRTPPPWLRPWATVLAVGAPAHLALQALVRWDPPASPPARPPSGWRRTCLRPAGWPRSPATPVRSTTPRRCSRPARCRGAGPGRPRRRREPVVVRVPQAQGAALSAALAELQRLRSSRKLDAVRVQVDPDAVRLL